MALNLRLMNAASVDPAWKDMVEAAQKHLMKLGNIPTRAPRRTSAPK